ncbi:MAG: phosphoenolpyruvate carboxylase, partial [Stenotrophomonas sp.]
MNEYRSSIVFATPDIPLRDDVRRLGALVGDLLAEQVSTQFFDDVEQVRTRAIARRESDAPLSDLNDALTGLPPERAEAMVRAFSTYFQVVNIAERVHRIRRRRDYQRAGTATAQPDGLQDALQ